jgi:hypothetical protein
MVPAWLANVNLMDYIPLCLWIMQKQNFYFPECKARTPQCIVISGMSGCSPFLHIISQTPRFKKKQLFNTMRLLILPTNLI